jgi:tRNA dimethylallyltransferase
MTSKKSSDGNSRPKAVIICGPTGSGKSELGMMLCEKYEGRIISADSRQIYRRLDRGTAKPSLADRSRVPHYMIDVADIDEDFSAKKYSEMASTAIKETLSDNKLPFIVGGAGLYLSALTGGLFEGPPADPELRRQLESEADNLGSDGLHRELSMIDPEAAIKISSGDRVRIIRALEVYRLTGYKISELQSTGDYDCLNIEFLWLGLAYDRNALYERINLRVDRMIVDGLVDEVAGLREIGLGSPLKQKRIVGYYEVLDALDGLMPMNKAVDLIKQHSRNYAKRQVTWFRHKSPVKWLTPKKANFHNEVFDIIDDYLKERA